VKNWRFLEWFSWICRNGIEQECHKIHSWKTKLEPIYFTKIQNIVALQSIMNFAKLRLSKIIFLFFIKIPFSMFLFVKNVPDSFRRDALVLLLGLCLPLFLQGQNLAIRLRTIGNPSDTAFAGNALRQITKSDYVYLAVYGTEQNNNTQALLKGKYFGFWYESKGSGGVVLKTATQLASWIADSKNGVTDVKPTVINKDIVLLSSAPAKATQELAEELGQKDAAAKRNIRKIIGWEEDVLLYKNGFFLTYGKCFQYEMGKVPQELTGNRIPTGNDRGTTAADNDFIVLSQASNIYMEWLETWPIATRGAIKEAGLLNSLN
jgi:hypothetical protein